MAKSDYERIHHEAIVIDAVCLLMMQRRYIDWWIEGGASAACPTVGAFQRAGPTLRVLGEWIRAIERDPRLVQIRRAADFAAAKAARQLGIVFHFQETEPVEDDLNLIDAYKALGVGMIQLAYNVTASATAARSAPTPGSAVSASS